MRRLLIALMFLLPAAMAGQTFTYPCQECNNTFTGTNTFNGPVSLNGGLSISGTVAGNLTFSGNVTISGTAALSGGGSLTGTFTGNPTFSGSVTLGGVVSPLLVGDGTAAAPSHSFTNNANRGMYNDTGNSGIGFSVGGIERAALVAGGLGVAGNLQGPSTGIIGFTSAGFLAGIDTGISRCSANVVCVGNASGDFSGFVKSANVLSVNGIQQASATTGFGFIDFLGVSHVFISGTSPYTNLFLSGNGSGGVFLGSAAKSFISDTTGSMTTDGSISLFTTTHTLPGVLMNDSAGGMTFTGNGGHVTQFANSGTLFLGNSSDKGSGIGFFGATSGTVNLNPPAVAGSTVLTLPAAGTDTLMARADTATMTNKTYDTAGTGNVFKINGNTISSNTGSGAVNVLQTGPTLISATIQGTTTISAGATITTPAISSPTTTGTDSGTETLNSKTLESPVINGSPTGTGIPTVTLKTGTGVGNYTTASTTFVRVDSTNLANTVTIPTGWKLLVNASGAVSSATAAGGVNIALADGSADNTGILISLLDVPTTSGAGAFSSWALSWVINGNGASHTINLQFDTGNAADSAIMVNNTSTLKPTMTFLLTPSN